MKDLCTKSVIFFKKSRLVKAVSGITVISSVCIFLMSNLSGPAKNGNAVTGASFNSGQTCAKSGCHKGGAFGGTLTMQLLDGNRNAVSAYEPGKSYTFRMKFNKTTGTPQYGWQTTVATSGTNLDINTWGALPVLTHVSKLSGRNYFEHSTRATKDSVIVPWTAPAANTGAVVFYTAGNFVNADGNTTGDQVVTATLTVSEASTLPVRLNYFKGALQAGTAVLNWSTATEVNNRNFIIEKSTNGTQFSDLVTIPCKGNSNGSTYSYTDNNFSGKAYYRLKQTDFDGHSTTYNTVELSQANATQYSLSVYAHAGSTGLIFHNGNQTQKIIIRYNDLQGRLLYSGNTTANQGDNLITIPAGINKSMIIVSVITADGTRISTKVGVQR